MPQSQTNQLVVRRARNLFKLWRAPRNQVEDLARARLLEVLNYAKSSSPWWERHLAALKTDSRSIPEILSSLPITQRQDLQEHFEDMQILNGSITSDQLTTLSTSGSTGQPVRTVKHKYFYGVNFQGISLFEWALHKRDVKGRLLYLKYGEKPLDNVIMRPIHLIGGGRNAIRRDPGEMSAREVIAIIRDYKPKYILGTLHLVRVAADYAKVNQIPVHGILEKLITHADPVSQGDRELIREVFGAEISNRYSSEEVGWIAIQCTKADHLHVVAPHMIVEILDKDLKPCGPGETGEVYLTQLMNFTMPIIRYRLGDMARWGAECEESSWPVIEEIVGRTRDSLLDKNGDEFVPALGSIKPVKESKILEYQIFLFTDAIAFVYRADLALGPELVQEITSELQSRLRTELPVEYFRSERVAWRSEYKKRTFLNIQESIKGYPDGEAILELGQRSAKKEVV